MYSLAFLDYRIIFFFFFVDSLSLAVQHDYRAVNIHLQIKNQIMSISIYYITIKIWLKYWWISPMCSERSLSTKIMDMSNPVFFVWCFLWVKWGQWDELSDLRWIGLDLKEQMNPDLITWNHPDFLEPLMYHEYI